MKNFPQYHEALVGLMAKMKEENTSIMEGFGHLHKASIESGALSSKMKELIALGIAITVRCDGCIAFHVHDALKAGASRQEILETIGVAILMGGGPSMVYGCEALAAVDQFEANAK